jgi:hypothetical protein
MKHEKITFSESPKRIVAGSKEDNRLAFASMFEILLEEILNIEMKKFTNPMMDVGVLEKYFDLAKQKKLHFTAVNSPYSFESFQRILINYDSQLKLVVKNYYDTLNADY